MLTKERDGKTKKNQRLYVEAYGPNCKTVLNIFLIILIGLTIILKDFFV